MTTYRATAGLVLVVTLLGGCGVSSRCRFAYPHSMRSASYLRDLRCVSKAGEEFVLHAQSVDSFNVHGAGVCRADPASGWAAFSGSVPLDSIALVAEPGIDIGRTLITAGVCVAVVAALDDASDGPKAELTAHFRHYSGGGGSCPFVYSEDGDGWALDAEPFAGAIFWRSSSSNRTPCGPTRSGDTMR